jgi:ADP-ribosylglycohydrolase
VQVLGAIVGDIIGSVHEGAATKTMDFELCSPDCRFTDDSILTVAVADALLTGSDYAEKFREYFARYPGAGYGMYFTLWASRDGMPPYDSWGNGSAMRVSPVAYAFDSLDSVMTEAARSAEVTHNHPEGIRGAQATATAVYLARRGEPKESIRGVIDERFGYPLRRTLDEIRPTYRFDVSCQGTVPPALIAFLESRSYEDTVRRAISLGGDADTLACIAGSIAEAHYGGVPRELETWALSLLDDSLRRVISAFRSRYGLAAA